MNEAAVAQSVIASMRAEADDPCEILSATEVDAAERAAAEAVLAVMKDELHLPQTLRVGWFRSYAGAPDRLPPQRSFGHMSKTAIGTYRYWSDPDTIWIKAGIGARQVASTVIHEARHCWQWQVRRGVMTDADNAMLREIDAYLYEQRMVEHFTNAGRS